MLTRQKARQQADTEEPASYYSSADELRPPSPSRQLFHRHPIAIASSSAAAAPFTPDTRGDNSTLDGLAEMIRNLTAMVNNLSATLDDTNQRLEALEQRRSRPVTPIPPRESPQPAAGPRFPPQGPSLPSVPPMPTPPAPYFPLPQATIDVFGTRGQYGPSPR